MQIDSLEQTTSRQTIYKRSSSTFPADQLSNEKRSSYLVYKQERGRAKDRGHFPIHPYIIDL